MTERPKGYDEDEPDTAGLAPETDNSEQDADEDGQAQTVADEARTRGTDLGLDDSEKVNSGDDSDDVPDLIDRMKQMNSSGRIDMDAYRGERNDDDEDGLLGEGADEE